METKKYVEMTEKELNEIIGGGYNIYDLFLGLRVSKYGH